ncbi:MAG: hypothetical protein ABSE58_10870 [Candidatus Limnocylindrales bacterium]
MVGPDEIQNAAAVAADPRNRRLLAEGETAAFGWLPGGGPDVDAVVLQAVNAHGGSQFAIAGSSNIGGTLKLDVDALTRDPMAALPQAKMRVAAQPPVSDFPKPSTNV